MEEVSVQIRVGHAWMLFNKQAYYMIFKSLAFFSKRPGDFREATFNVKDDGRMFLSVEGSEAYEIRYESKNKLSSGEVRSLVFTLMQDWDMGED